ncbi:MAG: hypothetical protein AVDCRST_MAG75-1927, partial [uncultured Propionibacteriaceae bacterium]
WSRPAGPRGSDADAAAAVAAAASPPRWLSMPPGTCCTSA